MLNPFIVVPVVVAVIGVLVWYLFFRGPNLSAYLFLNEPRIITEPDVMVLEIAGEGPAEVVAKQGFTALFKVYFKLKGVPKGPGMPLPRGRWRFDSPDAPELFGRIAIPVPESVTLLPSIEPPQDMTMQITRWEYGEVAEILHIGPYENEPPTVDRLKSFIDSSGYEIIGDHEELYLRGPGMFGKGNPAKYHTIIRFRVRKKTV